MSKVKSVKNSVMGSDGMLYQDGMLVDSLAEKLDLEAEVEAEKSVVVSKKYSSSLRGRIVNVLVNGKEVSSLTVGIIGMKNGWSNKDKDAIRMWNKVNSSLSKKGSHVESFEGKEFKFELVNVD